MMDNAEPPQLRSALFVPGHRMDLAVKACSSEADALILDLEDSVRDSSRQQARENVQTLISDPLLHGPRLCVRINALAAGHVVADLAAAVGPGLLAIVVPKVETADEIESLSQALAKQEQMLDLAPGRVRVWPLIESAAGVLAAASIAASSSRVAYMGGGTSRGGDLARSLGFRWTPDGMESRYARTNIRVDVRAARVPHPMTGVVTDIRDLDQVRAFATQSRGLGYEGLMVIHPSHVAIANQAFGTSAAERNEQQAIVEALDRAADRGDGAVAHDGMMVDAAMRTTAERILSRKPATEISLG
jgi:citrate lyase subunit beta/citryl-CoA lyase